MNEIKLFKAKSKSASVGPNFPTTILWNPVKCILYSMLG
jgi:hypothetical protein